ncbi:MAG: hypothetical protein HYW97_01400 [Candidatus Wildermuthbacteria bacterium]|nr:hypothetical protein [Candidatus Wildermuthbacteria bacterium]
MVTKRKSVGPGRTTKISLELMKSVVVPILVLIMVGSLVAIVIGIPTYQNAKFTSRLHTYRIQALQATTPVEFANALRQLDRSLDEFGMIQGDTTGYAYAEHNDMAYKRALIRELAVRADALTRSDIALTSAEVSTGLTDMRWAVANSYLSVYGFWLWSQGGIWVAVYVPLLVFGVALAFAIIVGLLPRTIRNPFVAPPQPA